MRRPGHNFYYYNCQKKRIYVKVHFVCNIKAGRTGKKKNIYVLTHGTGPVLCTLWCHWCVCCTCKNTTHLYLKYKWHLHVLHLTFLVNFKQNYFHISTHWSIMLKGKLHCQGSHSFPKIIFPDFFSAATETVTPLPVTQQRTESSLRTWERKNLTLTLQN